MRRGDAVSLDVTAARETDELGKTQPWTFTEDRRLKVVVCNALKRENDGNAGYPLNSSVLVSLNRGENEVWIALTEREHPDVAYIAVHAPERGGVFYPEFELWDGLPGDVDSRGRIMARKFWNELKGSGFAIKRGQPSGNLYLRMRYYDTVGNYTPVLAGEKSYRVGGVSLGGRSHMYLSVPWGN